MTDSGLELLKLVGRRSDLLAALVDQPRDKRSLEDDLVDSRSTLDRALRELEEAGLVRWDGDGYRATLAGRMQLQLYHEFVDRSADVLDVVEFLRALPPDAAIGPGLLAGSVTIEPLTHGRYELAPTMRRLLEDGDRVVVALSENMTPESLRKMIRTANDEGTAIESYLAPGLVDLLESGFPELLGGLAAGDCRVFEAPVERFGLMFHPAAGEVVIGADDEDGEQLGLLRNDTEEAVEWAEQYVADLRARGTEMTGEARQLARLAGDRDTLLTEGFVDLDQVDPREDASLARGWRTGLDLAEVGAGLAVERERPSEGERVRVAEEVTAALADGDDLAVLGPPGSGKSTVCKAVAWRWHETDRGPVLYRESGAGEPFSSWPLLAELLREAEGHALVVVEDAVRPQANDVFRVMAEFTDRDDVTVLLDAREHEWHDPPSFPADGRLEAYRVEDVETVQMPPLDDREIERFADRFEAATDATLDVDPEQLLATIRAASEGEAGPAALQLLLHRLALRAAPLVAEEYRTPTTLVEDVRRAVTDVQPLGEAGLAVAAVVNLLNAAGVAPTPAHLHAVAGAFDGDHETVAAAIERLEGRVLFDGAKGWRAVHESWSALFLETLGAELGEDRAAELVGTALTALLSLADDPDLREAVATAVGDDNGPPAAATGDDGPPAVVEQAASDPGAWAADLVEQLFRTPVEYPGLAPLFGTVEGGAVELPDALPPEVRAEAVRWRARGYRESGDLERAATEYETLADRAAEWATERAPRLEGQATAGLGSVAYRRGNLDAAEERYRAALEAAEQRGDRERVATNRKHLGNVAWARGELDAAEEHYRAALETFRELEDPLGAAYVRHNLGNVVDEQGDSEAAERHYRAALATYRDLGDRGDEADCLNNLGVIAERRGALDAAAGYYRRCLQRYGELGDSVGEATALANLGLVADKQGDPDEAERYADRALERYRAVGDSQGEAFANAVLGGAARQRGEFDAAEEHLQESRATYGEVGDRKGVAAVDCRLARVARDRGDLERAEAVASRASETATDVGRDVTRGAAELLVGDVARRRGDAETAAEHFEASRSAHRAADVPIGAAVAAAGLAELALADGDPEAALDRLLEGFEPLAEAVGEDDDPGTVLVDACERAGHLDALADPLRAALRADGTVEQRVADLRERLGA